MPKTTEAFSRVKIDAQLRDVGWTLEDGISVHFEYVLCDGTKADYVLCDRTGHPLAVIEAKRQSTMPIQVCAQGMWPKGTFRHANTTSRPFIDGSARRGPMVASRLHVQQSGVTINRPGGFHIGNLCLTRVSSEVPNSAARVRASLSE